MSVTFLDYSLNMPLNCCLPPAGRKLSQYFNNNNGGGDSGTAFNNNNGATSLCAWVLLKVMRVICLLHSLDMPLKRCLRPRRPQAEPVLQQQQRWQ